MKKIITVLLILLNYGFSFAQEGFIKTYELGYPALNFLNMILHEDTLILSGIASDDTFPYVQGMVLVKLDTSGNYISDNLYLDSLGGNYGVGADRPVDFIKASDESGYLLLTHSLERKNRIILKINNSGNLIWTKEYVDTISLQEISQSIIEMDNGYLVGGRKTPANFSNDVFIMRIDKDGNMLWEKSFGGSDKRYSLHDLVKIDNNEYVMGISTLANQGVPWQEWEYSSIIWAIDSLGNEKWKWESESDMEEIKMKGLHKSNAGDWVYTTFRGEHYAIGQSWQWTNTQAKFIVRDNDFNLIEERVYDSIDGWYNIFNNMISLTDGDWLGLGGNYEEVPIPNLAEDHVYSWIARISDEQSGLFSLGDSIWTRKDLIFPDTANWTFQELHSAIELSSASIIAAGNFEGPGYSQMGVLVKLNQHGCLEIHGCEPTNLNPVKNLDFNPKIKTYPNPVKNILFYESDIIPVWNKVELVDINGRIIYSDYDKKLISVEGLSSGVYFLRLWHDNQVWVQKFVKF